MAAVELLPLRDLQACCSPITREAIARENAESLAHSLRALDPLLRAIATPAR